MRTGARALRIEIDLLAADGDMTAADIDRQHDRLADEGMNESGRRVVVDFLGRADLLDLALVHHHHAVGDFQRFFLIVRDEDRRHVNLVMQRAQPAPQLLAHLGIERAEGLVEQKDARLDGERTRERHALTLPPDNWLG